MHRRRRGAGDEGGLAGSRARAGIAALAVSAVTVIWVGGVVFAAPTASGSSRVPVATKPNVVLILTDDQRWDTLWAMPKLRADLAGHGVTVSNEFVVNSLCCPSRTSILTGRYSHSTGVYTNQPPLGGFPAFHDGSTVATWLHGAGYRTGLVGKYLNAYEGNYVPPGWDQWFALSGPPGYLDYQVNDGGAIRGYGSDPADYSTDVFGADADAFVRATPAKQPLFLYLATWAPHEPPIPAQPYADRFSDLRTWRPPNYDEANVADKPAWVRARARYTTAERARIDSVRTDQYRTLLSVDDMVDRVVTALADTGRLSNTMIVFTSDNGFAWGEHRWANKQDAYEESIRVPFVVRYDPLTSDARTDPHLALNIDIAPTFAGLAGVTAPGAEGRSLIPLLRSPQTSWRDRFLIEHVRLPGPDSPPTYCAVRTTTHLYVSYATHEEELYDLVGDPFELANLAANPGSRTTLVALRASLRSLCRPAPPGWTFATPAPPPGGRTSRPPRPPPSPSTEPASAAPAPPAATLPATATPRSPAPGPTEPASPTAPWTPDLPLPATALATLPAATRVPTRSVAREVAIEVLAIATLTGAAAWTLRRPAGG